MRPGEREIHITHKHPAALQRFVALPLVALAAAGTLSDLVHQNGALILVIWLAWLSVVLNMLNKVFVWSVSFLIVTDKRLILATGMRRSASVHLGKVERWSLQDSFWGLILGYKSLVLQSESDDDKVMRTIGWIPSAVAKSIETILPSTTRNVDDDKVFNEWDPGGGSRYPLKLIVAVLLICPLVVLAAAAAQVPHIRTELNNQNEVIALLAIVIPIVITLIASKD